MKLALEPVQLRFHGAAAQAGRDLLRARQSLGHHQPNGMARPYFELRQSRKATLPRGPEYQTQIRAQIPCAFEIFPCLFRVAERAGDASENRKTSLIRPDTNRTNHEASRGEFRRSSAVSSCTLRSMLPGPAACAMFSSSL